MKKRADEYEQKEREEEAQAALDREADRIQATAGAIQAKEETARRQRVEAEQAAQRAEVVAEQELSAEVARAARAAEAEAKAQAICAAYVEESLCWDDIARGTPGLRARETRPAGHLSLLAADHAESYGSLVLRAAAALGDTYEAASYEDNGADLREESSSYDGDNVRVGSELVRPTAPHAKGATSVSTSGHLFGAMPVNPGQWLLGAGLVLGVGAWVLATRPEHTTVPTADEDESLVQSRELRPQSTKTRAAKPKKSSSRRAPMPPEEASSKV